MKCLLIMPPFSSNEIYSFPLGICYISAAMKRIDGVETINLNLNPPFANAPDEYLLDALKKHQVDAVLSGGLFSECHAIKRIFKIAKEFNPKLITIAGGMLITGDPEPAMAALECADYGIIGEGEDTITELCQYLRDQKAEKCRQVQGLIIKEAGSYETTPPREAAKDLGLLPWPDYAGFGFDQYLAMEKHHRSHVASIGAYKTGFLMTSRGCPYRCTFCHNSQGKKYRQRPLDDVFAELDFMITRHGIEQVLILDDLLAEAWPRLEEFCRRIKQYNFKGWFAGLRVHSINERVVNILKEAGCGFVSLGLESADNDILKSMKKGITIEQIEEALALLEKMEMPFMGSFIFGDPAENATSCHKTIKWWKEHPQYRITVSPLFCWPGSEVYRSAVKSGRIKDPVKFLLDGCPPVNISKLSDDEFQNLVNVRIPALTREAARERHQLDDPRILEIDVEKHKMTLSGTCVKCGRQLLIRDLHLFSYYCRCQHCNTLYNVPPARGHRENAAANLAKALDKYGEIAIWGIGPSFEQFIAPELVNLPGLHLVDRDYGRHYGSKIVEPPEIIQELNIRFIVTVIKFSWAFPEIKQRAQSLGVTKMIDLLELQAKNLVLP